MQNITSDQKELLDRLMERDPDLTVEWDEARGVAAMVRGDLAAPSGGEDAAEANTRDFLSDYGMLFGPPDLIETVNLLRERTDDLGWAHLEFQQTYNAEIAPDKREDLEVYGSRLATHFSPEGALAEVQSSCWRDIQQDNQARLGVEELRERLTEAAANAPGFPELQQRARKQEEKDFPVMQRPRLVLYRWQGGFRLSWATYAYGAVDVVEEATGQPTGAKKLDLGQVFVDASTGELFLFASMSRHAETPDTGTGLGVTRVGGAFAPRTLNIVRVDSSSTYRLRDKTHRRDIITYDAANSDDFNTDTERQDGLNGGSLPVSADTDGDKNWNVVPSDASVTQRTASQQPEVDLHHFARAAYEWYDALAGGRAGWDDGQYPNPPVPPQPVRSIAHVKNGTNPSSINAGERLRLASGRWLCWLQFFDGDGSTYDYISGSKWLVGHEYQHAITDFTFEDAVGNPGLMYAGWLSAVHEGLSDVFGGLFAEQWLPATEISPRGQIWRNLVYPPDDGPPPASAAFDANKHDHFADRNVNAWDNYARGTILAHCAYLMGQGGVHQRTSRAPALIPVYGLGHQTHNGMNVLKAARIWYRAVTYYFSTHGTATGIPANDENVFRTLRNACVSAAENVYGAGSPEHRTTILAFYAVGLQPAGTPYGPDVTFLRWGADWQLSRPYIGLDSPEWSSRDLFIKNGPGEASGWNARINVFREPGRERDPTHFENTVYCRVRNVGDQEARNVRVTFEYAKVGTGILTWQPMRDRANNPQTLNVGTLAPGQSNFPDSSQNTPPATASVKWDIPPLRRGETVHHFCIRARVTSDNDVNPHNNEVQSNVVYAPYRPGMGASMAFMAGNPTEKEIPLELQVHAQLPQGWKASISEGERPWLRPGEERTLQAEIEMPPGADEQLEPPLDGELEGTFFGSLSGSFSGTLTETAWDGEHLQGRFAANLEYVGVLVGGFEGELNVLTGEVKGRVSGVFRCAAKEGSSAACVGVEACLRPLRRVDISQIVDEEQIGGITIQAQVPMPDGPCARELPPTDTEYRPTR